jgi:DNA-binding XRE family transcriptional regulator
METANAIGISQVVYCQYECGAKCPNINVAAKLAKLFGVSLDYLVGVVDDENE